jgi:hypothetical protein
MHTSFMDAVALTHSKLTLTKVHLLLAGQS